MGQLLDELLRRRNLRQPLQLYELQRRWPELVGVAAAGRSWPAALVQGRLTVHVADSSWVQELTFLKAELLAKARSAVGEDAVSELRFFVRAGARAEEDAAWPVEPAPQGEPPAAPPLPPDVAQALDAFEGELDSVEDPELRRAIRRAFVEHLLSQ